jgi:PleD family two-component response regulator
LRLCERRLYTYFILLSARGEREHVLTGVDAGADDYLTKPLAVEELKVRLISASRVTSLHRQLAEKTVILEQLNRQLERLNHQLFEQARTDPLTGLGNRTRLLGVLRDIDFFKPYNDFYGHLAGDEVLIKAADTVKEHLPSGDAAYRYGGEEFLIVLPEQPSESAGVAADRVRRAVENLRIPHEAKAPPGVLTGLLFGHRESPRTRCGILADLRHGGVTGRQVYSEHAGTPDASERRSSGTSAKRPTLPAVVGEMAPGERLEQTETREAVD